MSLFCYRALRASAAYVELFYLQFNSSSVSGYVGYWPLAIDKRQKLKSHANERRAMLGRACELSKAFYCSL